MYQVVRCYPFYPTDLSDLWANGEAGDWWRFDNAHTTRDGLQQIGTATGTVSGRTLTQDTDLLKPAIETVDGIQCADFSPNDLLVHSIGSTVSQPGTIILSLRSTDTATHAIVTGGSSSARWQVSNDGSDNIIMFAGATLDTTINANYGTKLFTAEFNGASSKFRQNGTEVGSGNAGSQSISQLSVGALWDGSFGVGMKLYSLLFINRLLTESERDRAERLLGGHAGLSW